MKNDTVQMALLYDFYSETLTDKQRLYFDMYYGQDMSLSEISEEEHITRQGARDVIARAENTLFELEGKLGLVSRYGNTLKIAERLKSTAAELNAVNDKWCYGNGDIRRLAEEIETLADALRSNE
ncbi:hypothetical protein FACS1894202_05470 [Clostridia bacterium]|nr:hypothetical protein FACS1894202_05470 [Clostridia bacterium]